MSQDFRFSIDTLYFGLQICPFEAQHLLEVINNFLFWYDVREINYDFSINRFYHCSYQNKDRGMNIFFKPRKHCKNDYICFELNGRFFKDIELSVNFVEFIFEFFNDRINFQRLDIAIDVIYDSAENVSVEPNTNLLGFPFPFYSESWRYQRLPFEMYGRIINNAFFINMVYQGKNDVRLRVYDKQLDLNDKYKECYSNYYCLDIKDSLVYRIELQMRSDKLKNYIEQFMTFGLELTYLNLISTFVNYIFYKYQFKFLESLNLEDIRFFSTYKKRVPELAKQIEFYRRQMIKFYIKYLDSSDEYNEKLLNVRFLKKNYENKEKFISYNNPTKTEVENVGHIYSDLYSEKIQKGI